MDGLLKVFSLEVPKRHVHCAHRANRHGTAAEVHRTAIHFLPEPFGLQRIFAQKNFAESAGDGVAVGRVNDGLDHFRGRVRFANAFEQVSRDLLAPADLNRTLDTDGVLEAGFMALASA